VVEKIKNQVWAVKCKHCDEMHVMNQREIYNGAHTRQCKKFKAHNASGLEKWDGIIRRTYGISLAEYNAMLSNQGNACAICGKHASTSKRRLAIDHCHKTKVVRGVLCDHCNQGLGHFKDDPKRLITAARYLETFANAR
jgi:hypothetical protein